MHPRIRWGTRRLTVSFKGPTQKALGYSTASRKRLPMDVSCLVLTPRRRCSRDKCSTKYRVQPSPCRSLHWLGDHGAAGQKKEALLRAPSISDAVKQSAHEKSGRGSLDPSLSLLEPVPTELSLRADDCQFHSISCLVDEGRTAWGSNSFHALWPLTSTRFFKGRRDV